MKASIFIKVALIDQMQQIADLGLWFHLAKLIPSGVELLERVWCAGVSFNYDGHIFLPETIERMVSQFYAQHFPDGYEKGYPTGTGFFNIYPKIWLTSEPSGADKHLQPVGEKKEWQAQPYCIHVPQWFEDFKNAAGNILAEIESGKLEDIEVLREFQN